MAAENGYRSGRAARSSEHEVRQQPLHPYAPAEIALPEFRRHARPCEADVIDVRDEVGTRVLEAAEGVDADLEPRGQVGTRVDPVQFPAPARETAQEHERRADAGDAQLDPAGLDGAQDEVGVPASRRLALEHRASLDHAAAESDPALGRARGRWAPYERTGQRPVRRRQSGLPAHRVDARGDFEIAAMLLVQVEGARPVDPPAAPGRDRQLASG